MKVVPDLKRMQELISPALLKFRQLGTACMEMITCNFAEGFLYPKKCFAVFIEKDRFAAIHASKFLNRVRIKIAAEHKLGEGKPLSADMVASMISLVAKQKKFKTSGIVLVIPPEAIIARVVELPAAVRDNLPAVVSYELDRLTPLSTDEAYYDFHIIGGDEQKVELRLLAVRRDFMDSYLQALKVYGIHVDHVTTSLSALTAFCAYTAHMSDFLLLAADGRSCEGGLVVGGALVSTFNIRCEDGNGKPLGERLAAEVDSTKKRASQTGNVPEVIVCPSGNRDFSAAVEGLGSGITILEEDAIKRKLGMTNSEELVPFQAIGGALGAILPKAKVTDLLSMGKKEVRRLPLAVPAILLLLGIGFIILTITAPLTHETRRIEEIQRQITMRKQAVRKVEGLKKDIEAAMKDISVINDFKEKRPMLLSVLKELTITLPKTVWLTRARMTDRAVELEGYAASAAEILEKLEQSSYLKKVEFGSPTVHDQRMNADRFVIKMEIEGFETRTSSEGDKKDEKNK